MCSIPPPPPLPTEHNHNSLLHLVNTQPSNEICVNSLGDTCQWATEYPELREACLKNNICLNGPPAEFRYKHFESIQQVGPTCGLVALSMMLNGVLPAAEILNIAKSERYTNNGEMFSCKAMLELAQKVLHLTNVKGVNMSLHSNGLYSDWVIKRLLGGTVVLVPYPFHLLSSSGSYC